MAKYFLILAGIVALATAGFAADYELESVTSSGASDVSPFGKNPVVDDTWIHYLGDDVDEDPDSGVFYPPQAIGGFLASGQNYEISDFPDMAGSFVIDEIAWWGSTVSGNVIPHIAASDPFASWTPPSTDLWVGPNQQMAGQGQWEYYTDGLPSDPIDPADDCPDGWIAIYLECLTDYGYYYFGLDQSDYEKDCAMGYHWQNGVWQFFTGAAFPGDHYIVFHVTPVTAVQTSSIGAVKALFK